MNSRIETIRKSIALSGKTHTVAEFDLTDADVQELTATGKFVVRGDRIAYHLTVTRQRCFEKEANAVEAKIQELRAQAKAYRGNAIRITRPKGKITGRAFDIFEANEGLPRRDLLILCVEDGINPITAASQYQRFRAWKASQ